MVITCDEPCPPYPEAKCIRAKGHELPHLAYPPGQMPMSWKVFEGNDEIRND